MRIIPICSFIVHCLYKLVFTLHRRQNEVDKRSIFQNHASSDLIAMAGSEVLTPDLKRLIAALDQ